MSASGHKQTSTNQAGAPRRTVTLAEDRRTIRMICLDAPGLAEIELRSKNFIELPTHHGWRLRCLASDTLLFLHWHC